VAYPSAVNDEEKQRRVPEKEIKKCLE